MSGWSASRQTYCAFELARYVPRSEASAAEYTAADCTSVSMTSQWDPIAVPTRWLLTLRFIHTMRPAMRTRDMGVHVSHVYARKYERATRTCRKEVGG